MLRLVFYVKSEVFHYVETSIAFNIGRQWAVLIIKAESTWFLLGSTCLVLEIRMKYAVTGPTFRALGYTFSHHFGVNMTLVVSSLLTMFSY